MFWDKFVKVLDKLKRKSTKTEGAVKSAVDSAAVGGSRGNTPANVPHGGYTAGGALPPKMSDGNGVIGEPAKTRTSVEGRESPSKRKLGDLASSVGGGKQKAEESPV